MRLLTALGEQGGVREEGALGRSSKVFSLLPATPFCCSVCFSWLCGCGEELGRQESGSTFPGLPSLEGPRSQNPHT